MNHNNPQSFISDLSCCLLVPILTVASESHTYLPFSKERKTLRLFSPYLCLHSLFPSEVTLGAVLMFLRAEVPSSPRCLIIFTYIFNRQLQAFCLSSHAVCWFTGHLCISSWRAEGPHMWWEHACLKKCCSIPKMSFVFQRSCERLLLMLVFCWSLAFRGRDYHVAAIFLETVSFISGQNQGMHRRQPWEQ